MVRQRISDIITRDVIDRDWKLGMKILIKSQTGSGKSWFAQNTIYEYCRDNGYKCLLFSNRTILRRQNEKELVEKGDVFTVLNYQNVNEKIHNGIHLSEIYNGYDVILMDEAHFYIEDSPFNRKTDLLLKSLKYTYKNKLILLMTATPQMLFEYKQENSYDLVYSLPEDYSHIDKIFFYKGKDSIIRLLSNLPHGEKAIYFANSAEDAYSIMKLFPERASFICSPDKKWYGKFSDKKTLDEIVKNERFSVDILCTTKLLDTGVNIKDSSIKTIIIDSSDPVNIIQSIGRRRVVDDGKIILFVKNLHGGDIYQGIEKCNKNLWWAKELSNLGKVEFQNKHRKSTYPPIVDNDFVVNVAILTYYEYMLKFYKSLEKREDKFKKFIRNQFQNFVEEEIPAEFEIQKPDLIKVLEEIKDVKIFDDEQVDISEKIFKVILATGASNDRYVKVNAISKILKKTGVPFVVENKQETKGKNRKRQYWIFKKKESEKNETDRE